MESTSSIRVTRIGAISEVLVDHSGNAQSRPAVADQLWGRGDSSGLATAHRAVGGDASVALRPAGKVKHDRQRSRPRDREPRRRTTHVRERVQEIGVARAVAICRAVPSISCALTMSAASSCLAAPANEALASPFGGQVIPPGIPSLQSPNKDSRLAS